MIVIAIMAVVFIILLVAGLCSPFHYPYFTHAFNVSKKRNPQEEIDRINAKYSYKNDTKNDRGNDATATVR